MVFFRNPAILSSFPPPPHTISGHLDAPRNCAHVACRLLLRKTLHHWEDDKGFLLDFEIKVQIYLFKVCVSSKLCYLWGGGTLWCHILKQDFEMHQLSVCGYSCRLEAISFYKHSSFISGSLFILSKSNERKICVMKKSKVKNRYQ